MGHRFIIGAGMWEELRAHLLGDQNEHVAFVLAGHGRSEEEEVLLARELIVIADADLEPTKNSDGLSLRLDALLRVMNLTNQQGLALVEAHSHPLATDHVEFSSIDRVGQREMAIYLADTLPGRPYGAIVLGQHAVDGCIWVESGKHSLLLAEIRVLGDQVLRLPTSTFAQETRASARGQTVGADEVFHRQILALGDAGHRKVREMKVAIGGLGGIGSVLTQQLAYLGVERFVLVDDDRVERTNLNRLVGATPADIGRQKTDVAHRLILAINPRAKIRALAVKVRASEAIESLKGVDVLFGCVDTDAGRLILNELALAYLIPYIDCGVGIRAGAQGLDEAGGKVSVWTPGNPCLLCVKDFSPRIAAEELESEAEREFRRRHGYVAGAYIPEPAVISLNSTIASFAVTEFLALITGVRPVHPYTYYDLLEGRAGPRIVSSESRCTACALLALGDTADLERYGRYGLPSDLPQLA